MDELKILYDELRTLPVPTGFAGLVDDLDTTVYLYGDDIIGYANSYLAGNKVNPINIVVDEDLDRRLEACIEKTKELLLYKRRIDVLATVLAKTLSNTKDI